MRLRDEGYTVFLCSHLLEQVQEVCDRVGIIFKGRMRQEGPLEELIAIEDQTSLTLEGAGPELLAKVRELVESDSDARLVDQGHPNTTLERLFISLAAQRKTEDESSDE